MDESAPKRIRVRSTVNLPGLPVGQEAWSDPTVPYIQEQLRDGFLVAVDASDVAQQVAKVVSLPRPDDPAPGVDAPLKPDEDESKHPEVVPDGYEVPESVRAELEEQHGTPQAPKPGSLQ